MRQTMEGHINTGFTASISSLALHTKEQLKAGIGEDKEMDVDEGLHDVSIVSDLAKKDASLLHGYCDRSFEKAILTFTNGDSGPLSNPDTLDSITRDETVPDSDDVIDVDARLGKYSDTLKLS